ncbi:Ig-like domain-containing protein [Cohnella sp. CBP 2801]|uniref:Ig-like domain-containing protein n=1 Tax=Cohnella zeiphila TaxID=2761120 RepID=A0A7X0SS39_9BACL|nr:Ig-like domain-containing protein [Cohnella zeiphila]
MTFDLNGAPGTPPSSLHVLASTVQEAGLSLATPNPEGYEFDGWYTSDGVLFTDTTPIPSITSTGGATLYAHWKEFKIGAVGALSDIHVPYGTELEDVGLPGSVNVTLSNGATEAAAVTWDGGSPAYDGAKAGTYVFTGSLTPPTGTANPDGKTASVNVIVDQPTVSSVGTLSDIHVPYGTELEGVGLPGTVNVTLSNGETKAAAVTWNAGTPAYDGAKPGTYAFTGTVTAPTGSTNPGGKTASVNVIVEEPTVTSVATLSDIHVAYGTELEDAGLPATVDVTLSSGETRQAVVSWDGGTPAYDGETPGTYAFTGTLTAPTGSTNPDAKTATVNVIVEEPTVTSVAALPDIHVAYGTELEDAGLPETVDVMLSNGDTKQAEIAWDGGTPAYDGETPGTYAFTGTLTAPTGSTNPDAKTASVNVIVEEPTVTSVTTLSDIHVAYGTELEDAGLPATVDVTLSSGETRKAAVSWDGGTPAYDGETPGTYAFTGTLTAPTGSTNPDAKTASVNVIVEEPTVTSVATMSDIHVAYGTKLEDAGLPATVDVTLSSGETKSAVVLWDGGTPAYDGETPGTYAFTGTLTAPTGSANPDAKTASVNVIVEEPTVTSVTTLSDIHVAYDTELEDAGLPATVDVTLSSGDTKQAEVTWDDGTPAYDGTKPGTYTFTGTLIAPADSTNPDGKTATVNVIVEEPTVTSVATLSDIHVAYGTKLEDAGLLTTVDVTLSSGETRKAAVSWDSGTPAYDGTKPGTYTFTGTLIAPADSTNPDGKTATVNVIVKEPIITSVAALSDIHVPYGTELEDAGLPTTVDVTLSSGETKQAEITWDDGTPSYDGTKPGTYMFAGTITAPAGSTNPDAKTATVNVIVEEPTVTSVAALSDIHVPYGMKLEDVGLPTKVDVTLSSGETKQARVTWDGGNPAYSGTRSGEYTFAGSLTPPDGATNPDNKTAWVKVIVNNAPIVMPATRQTVYCGAGICTANLGDQAKVSVPAHAAAEPFSLTLEMLESDNLHLPDGAQWLSKVFRLSKSIEEPLQLPMTLQIKLESTKIGDDHKAALFAYDEPTGQWTEVDGSLMGDVFTAQTDQFAGFAVLSVAEQTEQTPPPSLPDEPDIHLGDISGHWAETEIEAAVAKGIVTGYQDGSFRPNQQVSRVEFTAMLNRALKLNGSGDSSGSSEQPAFADAASIPAWARSSVAEAMAQGLIQGFADGTFRPGDLMSRAEMAAIAARALHLEAKGTELIFADANDIPAWAREAAALVQQAGLMKGIDGNRFAPLAPVTRAEAAVLIIRIIEQPQ